MKLNKNLTKHNIRVILNNLILSNSLKISCYDNGQPYSVYGTPSQYNLETLKTLFEKYSLEEKKNWSKLDIVCELWDAMELLCINIFFDQNSRKLIVSDKS